MKMKLRPITLALSGAATSGQRVKMVKTGFWGLREQDTERRTIKQNDKEYLETLIVAIGTVQFWREQPIHGVHPMTLQLAFWPALISGDDIDGDSWVSAFIKRNGLKD